METALERTPVALFVALTRAVREAAVPEVARFHAYDIIDRMARAVSLPGFEAELEALIACATCEPRLSATIQPFWKELRALSVADARRGRVEAMGPYPGVDA